MQQLWRGVVTGTLKYFSHLQKTDFVSYCVDTSPKGGMEVAELVNKSDQRQGKMWKKEKQVQSETSELPETALDSCLSGELFHFSCGTAAPPHQYLPS